MKTRITPAFLLLMSCFALSSCNEFGLLAPLYIFKEKDSIGEKIQQTVVQNYKSKLDQKYGPHPLQAYDVYTPVRDSSSQDLKSVSLVMIHGGGWSLLDKHYINNVVEEFKNQHINITIFNINHRLAGQNGIIFDDIMDDFRLFFKHRDSLKTELNLNDDIVLWGYSSGGHLALSYAYKYAYQNINTVAAVVAPTDLTQASIYDNIYDDKYRNLTELLLGQPYEEIPSAYKYASPYFYVNKRSPNTILFYGGSDILVNKEQGEKLYEKLKDKKVKAAYHLYPDASHEMQGKMGEISDETVRFLKDL